MRRLYTPVRNAFALSPPHRRAFAPVQSQHPFVIDHNTFTAKQHLKPSVAEPSALGRQLA